MGYMSMGYADPWGKWLIDQGARTDLLARWTTDSWARQGTGVSWPFHHLALDHVLVVRAQRSRLSIESWADFVAGRGSGSGRVCIYGGAVRAAVTSVLNLSRVLESPGTTEQFAHNWAAELLRNGTCDGYVQPIDKAENMLKQHNADGGCDLRLLNPPSNERDGLLTHARGGFSTVMPFARKAEAQRVSGNLSTSTGGGACTDIASAAFTRILSKMMRERYTEFRAKELAEQSDSCLTCVAQDCQSGMLDLGFKCAACDPASLNCNERFSITVLPGYYRASAGPLAGTSDPSASLLDIGPLRNDEPPTLAAYRCPYYEMCLGGPVAGIASCAPGSTGPLCATCKLNYHRTKDGCKECSGGAGSAIALSILGLFFLLVSWASISFMRSGLVVHGKEAEEGERYDSLLIETLSRLPWVSVATLAKILLGYIQCMTIFSHLTFIRWPAVFVDFLTFLDVFAFVDLLDLLQLDCLSNNWILGFGFQFYISLSLIPAVVLYVIMLSTIAALTSPAAPPGKSGATFRRRVSRGRINTARAWTVLQWWGLVLYPLIGFQCFRVFDCIDYDADQQILWAEPETVCYQGKHLTYSAISFVVIALFCVGFPLAVLISSHRAKAANSEAAARFVSLLTASYKPGFYYFEAVDLARKLLISSVLITITPRHRLQLFCGTLMSVLSAATFIGCRPYRKPLFNFLQGIAHVQILITFAAAMVFNQSDDGSKEELEEYLHDGELPMSFGVALILCNCCLLLSVPCYARFLYLEAMRIRDELNTPPNPSRPTVWLTSNGLSNARLKAEFVRLVVMRKLGRALPYEDCDGRSAETTAEEDLQASLSSTATCCGQSRCCT